MKTKTTAIPPEVPLGPQGIKLWRQTLAEFADWLPHDLVTLQAACLAWEEIAALSAELAVATDHKLKRQLRADRNAAITTYRQSMRELSLTAAPPDARPPRIGGRY